MEWERGREDKPWESGLRMENLHLFGQCHHPGPGDQVSQWHLALESMATACHLQCCSSGHVTGGQKWGEAKGRDLRALLFLAELQVWDQEAKRGPETLDLGVLPTLE